MRSVPVVRFSILFLMLAVPAWAEALLNEEKSIPTPLEKSAVETIVKEWEAPLARYRKLREEGAPIDEWTERNVKTLEKSQAQLKDYLKSGSLPVRGFLTGFQNSRPLTQEDAKFLMDLGGLTGHYLTELLRLSEKTVPDDVAADRQRVEAMIGKDNEDLVKKATASVRTIHFYRAKVNKPQEALLSQWGKEVLKAKCYEIGGVSDDDWEGKDKLEPLGSFSVLTRSARCVPALDTVFNAMRKSQE